MSFRAGAVLVLAGLFGAAARAWMVLLPAVAEHELRAVTGFDIRLTVLAANPFTGRLLVQGLSARNPPGYPAPEFASVRELRADVNEVACLLGDRIVVNDLSLDVPSVEIVRCRDGSSNVGALVAACSGGPGQPPAGPAPRKGRPRTYLVKRLHLKLGTLVIADYSKGTPEIRSYRLNIDHSFSNVSQARQLLVPDVVRSLYSFGSRRDAEQLLPGDFGRALSGAVGGVAEVGVKLRDAGSKTSRFLRGLLDKLEQSGKP